MYVKPNQSTRIRVCLRRVGVAALRALAEVLAFSHHGVGELGYRAALLSLKKPLMLRY